MLTEPLRITITVRPDGDANFYGLKDGARWIAVIQLNGEFHIAQQEAIMQRIAAAVSDELNRETP
jgi:hypothetical protein